MAIKDAKAFASLLNKLIRKTKGSKVTTEVARTLTKNDIQRLRAINFRVSPTLRASKPIKQNDFRRHLNKKSGFKFPHIFRKDLKKARNKISKNLSKSIDRADDVATRRAVKQGRQLSIDKRINMKTKIKGKLRFIRVRGRIIPIGIAKKK